MATKITCDCGREDCRRKAVVGRNAGQEYLVIRTAGGIRFRVEALPGQDGQLPDLRPSCVPRLLEEGEVLRDEDVQIPVRMGPLHLPRAAGQG